jgi:Nif-specific regulatory protein
MLALPSPTPSTSLRIHASAGLSEAQVQLGVWHRTQGVVGTVFSSGESQCVADVYLAGKLVHHTGAFNAEQENTLAFLAVPLKVEQTVHGVLAAGRLLGSHPHLPDDQRILTMVASVLAQALLLHEAVSSEHQRLERANTQLQKAIRRHRTAPSDLDHVIGQSKPMQWVFDQVQQAAPTRATVLLRGESGTGKELIAQAVHRLSPRKDRPFIAVNCAAISEMLLESELFGHERGAFTGAHAERKGRFEQAHGGTLFLDEIGDIPAPFQAKLLRVLQEREFERVGGSKTVHVDVRLICATNRPLEEMVDRGDFRSDLYFRINVIAIHLPPLRERRADIPVLVEHFIKRFAAENQRDITMTSEALNILMNCQWPGNVRELQNCIERAATMAQGAAIEARDVACEQNRCITKTLNHFDPTPHSEPTKKPDAIPTDERERLIWALAQCGGVQARAARLLNMSARKMSYALRKHGIEVHKF